jgi:3-deoxy-D-manno-octulosonic-acid transferase
MRPFVPFFKDRLNFERKNFLNESSLRFTDADYCFEVSSEGELEQVRPLIESFLKNKKKIEIIYSSPSVEEKCQSIYKLYPELVRVLRLPLLSGSIIPFLYFQSIWSWVSAPVIIFCRYDFFPELLLLKLFNKKFVLVSGAIKKTSWYKESSFKFFDVVIAATDLEKHNFEMLLGNSSKVFSCDFRVPRVAERFHNAEATLLKISTIQSYLQKIRTISSKQKIILGSLWPSDLAVLNHPHLIAEVKAGRLNILIAPHKLDQLTINELQETCARYFGDFNVEVVSDSHPYNKAPVVILQMSGILCELYSLFSMTYVGGGYERSIHSVLEPFFSNNMVITGPKISRSTEFDLAFEIAPDEIHILNNPESFYTIIESSDLTKLKLFSREQFLERSTSSMKLIISELLN